MSDISMQFHATPQELANYVGDLMSNMNLHVVGMSFPPFKAELLTGARIERGILNGPFWGLVFTESDPALPVASEEEYGKKNPLALRLTVGRVTSKGLEESWLACRTLNEPMPAAWKKFQSKLRSKTRCGAIAVRAEGATAVARNRRYTLGAKALSDKGVKMLAIAGAVTFELGI